MANHREEPRPKTIQDLWPWVRDGFLVMGPKRDYGHSLLAMDPKRDYGLSNVCEVGLRIGFCGWRGFWLVSGWPWRTWLVMAGRFRGIPEHNLLFLAEPLAQEVAGFWPTMAS